MSADNRLELIVQVDPKQANTALGSINKGLSSLEQQAVSSAKNASHGIEGMTASMTKGVLAGNALYDMAKKAFEMVKRFTLGALEHADSMGKMAQRYGIGVKDLTAYSYAANLADVDTQSLGTSLKHLSRGMLDAASGSKENRKYFALLKVEYQNSDKSLRPVGSVLEDIADRFEKLPDGATKTALALKLMGRSGEQMIPFLNAGGKAIRDMAEEGNKLGIVFDEKLAKDAEIVNDNIKRLKTSFEGLALNIARELLPKLIEFSERAVQWVKEGGLQRAAAEIKNIAAWVKEFTGAIAAYALVSGLMKLTSLIQGLNVALLANPWVAAAVGVGLFAGMMVDEYQKISRNRKELEGLNRERALYAELSSGKKVKDIVKAGYSEEEIRHGLTKGRQAPEFGQVERFKRVKGLGEDIDTSPQLNPSLGIEDDEAEKIRKFILQANRAAAEFKRSAEGALIGGAAREILEIQKEIDKLTTYVDEKGVETKVKLSAEARADIEQALQLKIQTLQKETARQIEKDWKEAARKRFDADTQYYLKRLAFEEQLNSKQLENSRELMRFQEERAGYERDAALRRLDLEEAGAPDLGGSNAAMARQIAFEARRADIEIEYAEKVHQVKLAEFDIETREILAQVRLQETILRLAGQDTAEIQALTRELESQRAQMRGIIDEQTQTAKDKARENVYVRQAQAIRDQQQRQFQSLKQQAEGVFDALVTKSQSAASAIGNAFKVAILTAVKEIVTSQVARSLMQLFGGLRMPVAGSSGAGGMGGMLGGIGSIMGGGAGGMSPGGTPPFFPSSGGGTGQGGGMGNVMNMGSGWKNFLGLGGSSPNGGVGPTLPWSEMSAGGKLSSIGKSNAAMMGGSLLFMYGANRGGLSGLGMTTAGGALAGYSIGSHFGPHGAAIGAAIGAGVGLATGIVGLFRKSAEKKVHEKVKATYGIDIQDKGVREQIVEMAKQSYGGNLDMAIRSQQVQDLVRLYAMTTGQKTGGLPGQMTASSLVQRGGSLYQQTQYVNGQAIRSPGGLIPAFHTGIDYVPRDMLAFLKRGERVTPAIQNSPLPGAGLSAIASRREINYVPRDIYLSPEAAQNLLTQGVLHIMNANPRTIQSGATKATKSNFNRRELTSLQLSPGTLTS